MGKYNEERLLEMAAMIRQVSADIEDITVIARDVGGRRFTGIYTCHIETSACSELCANKL